MDFKRIRLLTLLSCTILIGVWGSSCRHSPRTYKLAPLDPWGSKPTVESSYRGHLWDDKGLLRDTHYPDLGSYSDDQYGMDEIYYEEDREEDCRRR